MDPIILFTLLSATFMVLLCLNRNGKPSKLPRGSKSFPLVGETISFLKPHPATSMGDFMEDHISRYGKIFSTNVLGKQSIVSVDGELNRFVQNNEMRLFKARWPPAFSRILGKHSSAFADEEAHKKFRSIVMDFISFKRLQTVFLPKASHFASLLIKSWKDGSIICVKDEASKFSLHMFAEITMNLNREDPQMETLQKNSATLSKSLYSVPINLPGTAYWKGIKARKSFLDLVQRRMAEKLASKEKRVGDGQVDDGCDLLEWLMKTTEQTSEMIDDHVLGIFFAGYDTTASAIATMVYLLSDCPKAVKTLQEEHLQIVEQRSADSQLTWDDYKSMEFSQCVVNETLRLGNIAPFTIKQATRDVKYKDIFIPRGCPVIVDTRGVHLDPSCYDNPEEFDPWRWMNPSFERKTRNFMPFGGGIKTCPAQHLVKLVMTIFLHHLVLNYRWEPVEMDQPMSHPIVKFHKGLPVRIHALK